MTPTLYVKTGCSACAEAEAILDRNHISYDRVDVLRDRQAFKRMQEISGQTKAPTLEWGDHLLSNFTGDELTDFLKENNLH